MSMIKSSLSNLQKELLQLYGNGVSDQTLIEIKEMLAGFFAEKASDAIDEVWEDQHLTPENMVDWANGHSRVENRS